MIVMDLFQLRIFCGFMILLNGSKKILLVQCKAISLPFFLNRIVGRENTESFSQQKQLKILSCSIISL